MDNIYGQIILCLFLLLSFHIFIQIWIVRRIRRGSNTTMKEGPLIGTVLSKSFHFDLNRMSDDLDRKIVILILDVHCKECKSIINTLNMLKENYTAQFKIIVSSDEEEVNMDLIPNYLDVLVINQNLVMNNLEIRAFPFFVEVDSSFRVLKKGLLNKFELIELVN